MDYKQILSTINIIAQVPISLVNANGSTVFCMPDTEHHVLPPHVLKKQIEKFTAEKRANDIPFMYSTFFEFFDVYVGIIQTEDNNYIFLGPCTSQYIDIPSFENNSFFSELSHEDVMILHRIHKQTSTTESVRFANILSIISQAIGNHSSAIEILNFNYPEANFEYHAKPLNQKEPIWMSIQLFEEHIISAIKAGNRYELDELWKYPATFIKDEAIMSKASEQYVIIPYFTMLRLAANSGGASKGLAREVYSHYMDLYNQQKNSYSILRLMVQASYDFCNIVYSGQGVNFRSDICSTCEKYINEHIAEKITANDLAKLCHIDRSDIFDIFRANYNMSLTEYIQRERLRRAVTLMKNTNYTIGQVSSTLGFASQAYFGKVFSKYYGCTPGEFQKNNRRN